MIFEALQDNNLPYAVIVGTTRLLSTASVSIKDYCLIGSQRDWERLRDIGFTEPPRKLSHGAVLEYELNDVEVREFKDMIYKEQFEKILHNKHGRIYQRKGEEFKDYTLEYYTPGSKEIEQEEEVE